MQSDRLRDRRGRARRSTRLHAHVHVICAERLLSRAFVLRHDLVYDGVVELFGFFFASKVKARVAILENAKC